MKLVGLRNLMLKRRRVGMLKGSRREEEMLVELDCMAACNSPGGQVRSGKLGE